MYAIIATGGKQYKVAEGDVIRVEKLMELKLVKPLGLLDSVIAVGSIIQ